MRLGVIVMSEKEFSEIEILKDKHVTEAINSSLTRSI